MACTIFFARAQTVEPERLDELSIQQERESARESELRQTRDAVRSDIGKLKTNLTTLAAEARKIERAGRAIEDRLTALSQTEMALKTAVYSDRKTLMHLLAALQRVETNPPPALAISPQDAAEAAQAGKLISNVSARLKTRADALREQLIELDYVRADIDSEKSELALNEKALGDKQTTIKNIVTEKTKLERSIAQDQAQAQQRVADLAAEADSLRDLIQQFERAARDIAPRLKPKPGEEETPPPAQPTLRSGTAAPSTPLRLPAGTPRFADIKGAVPAITAGRITKSYSSARKGMTVATRSKAQITAPAAGRVEFAGPFKNYENVVILNVGDGYFILLTGLGEIYVEAGEIMATGEPLGLMPFNTQNSHDLYIELRKNGTTINPTPWLGTAFASNR